MKQQQRRSNELRVKDENLPVIVVLVQMLG